MTTVKLLWGMMWRAVAWNLILGTALGILTFLFALILALIVPEAPEPTPSIGEPALPIIIGCVLLPLVGTFEGFWVGLGSGIFLGILSRIFFFPLKNAQRFLQFARMTNALFSAAVFVISFSMVSVETSTEFITRIAFIFIAAIGVGCGVWLITLPIVKWYELESQREVTQNVRPI